MAINSVVGTLSATDDGIGTLAYTLAAGTGDIDNGAFTIAGSTLSVTASPDYETQSSYRIRIRVSDGEFVYSAAFTITVNDRNEAPTNLALSRTDIDENVAANSIVGTLSATDVGRGTLAYTLTAGNGDIDNGAFTITGSTLTVNASPDYETQSSYRIRIWVSNGEFASSAAFTIRVNDLNDAPTNLALSRTDIDENAAANSIVGTLSATDDGGGTLAYTLVAGSGDTDNGDFIILGNRLIITASPDYETQSSYGIRIQVSDGELVDADTFTIRVNDRDDLNEAPTDIALSKTDIDENTAAYSAVGTLSATDDGRGTLTYALAAGSGDTDNGTFSVRGNTTLVINASPDYETQSSYAIRIQVLDGGLVYAEAFSITVNDVNEAPTDIALSKTDIDENVFSRSVVGTLSATDDGVGTLVYTLAAGTGDIDNGDFTITGNQLSVNSQPNYEKQSSYRIRIQVSDGEFIYSEAFTITVNDGEDFTRIMYPADISLPQTDIDENVAPNSVVSTLSAIDNGVGTLVYSLAAGGGDTDNRAFTITGTTLTINASPDYETQSSYNIRIQASKGGEYAYSEAFSISVNDVNEAPTDIALSKTDVDENVAPNSVVGALSATDDALGGTLVYTLEPGAGDTDNRAFTITGSTLTINASPDYETQSSYRIRIQVTELAFEYAEAFTITVNDDGNIAPTDIALSETTIDENVAAGAVVGTLSATDDGRGTLLTYTLAAGTGDSDNRAFTITGNTLTINASPDYETKSSYAIRIQAADREFVYAKALTIRVNDVNEAPTDIALSKTDVDENVAANSEVGTLSATDDALGTLVYILAVGTGDIDNRAFTITGGTLTINASPDYETKTRYDIRIQVSDGEFTYSEAFTIRVNDDRNTTPTDIALSKTTIDNNVAAGAVVGTLGATDDGIGEALSYSLAAGGGDSDNDAFTITGNTLTINASPNYQTKSQYLIRIQVSDGEFIYSEAFTIRVNAGDANRAPTGITLSKTSIDENVADGTVVGTLSATDDGLGGALSYTMRWGSGDTDNRAFSITGNMLIINASPDYETKSSYRIRTQVWDGQFFKGQNFTITVNDVNEAPTDIALSKTDIDENIAPNSEVGTLSVTDDALSGALTYTLAAGNGDRDNGAFSITGNRLTVNASPDYETQSSYSIRIQVADGELVYSEAFSITVNDDGNTAPTDIALSKTDVDENVAVDSVVGTLSATDDGVGTLLYTLAAGSGDTDNRAFSITGNTLTITASPDYETQSSYHIRIQVSDGDLVYAEAFTIRVNDVNEAPFDIMLSKRDIDENVAVDSVVGRLSATDDALGTLTYALAAGSGDSDNRVFTITGNTLTINASPDYETKPGYAIRIQVLDGEFVYSEAFTIRVNDGEDFERIPAIQDIALSNADIDENIAANSLVGMIAVPYSGGSPITFILAAGSGDSDNGAFTITGASTQQLIINASPDYETQSSYSIRIQATYIDLVHR